MKRSEIVFTVFSFIGDYGKLGHGNNVTQKYPRLIAGPLSVKVVRWVSAGYRHSACVTQEGELYTWGEGDYGRLGKCGHFIASNG